MASRFRQGFSSLRGRMGGFRSRFGGFRQRFGGYGGRMGGVFKRGYQRARGGFNSLQNKLPAFLRGWKGGMIIGGVVLIVALAKSKTVRTEIMKAADWVGHLLGGGKTDATDHVAANHPAVKAQAGAAAALEGVAANLLGGAGGGGAAAPKASPAAAPKPAADQSPSASDSASPSAIASAS